MLTIVFYHTDGAAAKLRAREIVARGKGNYARVYDVGSWDGSEDKCDSVEIMPDITNWQRKRITDVYGEVEEHLVSDEEGVVGETIEVAGNKVPNNKTAKHRGGGRWFVMREDDIVSGPHEKAEAQRLAEIPDEPVTVEE